MLNAERSFTEPPGLNHSAFAQNSILGNSFATCARRSKGVLPMCSSTEVPASRRFAPSLAGLICATAVTFSSLPDNLDAPADTADMAVKTAPATASRCRSRGRALLPRNHRFRKHFHFFQLWTELQQQQIHSRSFKSPNPFCHLFRRANQPRAQPAIRDRVILETHSLLQLRACKPLLVISVARRRLLNVRNPLQLLVRFTLGFANHGVSRNAKFHRSSIGLRSALRHVSNLLANCFGRVPMH